MRWNEFKKFFCLNSAYVLYSSFAMESQELAAKSYLCRFLIARFSSLHKAP